MTVEYCLTQDVMYIASHCWDVFYSPHDLFESHTRHKEIDAIITNT